MLFQVGQVVKLCQELSPQTVNGKEHTGLMTQHLVIERLDGHRAYIKTFDREHAWIELLSAEDYQQEMDARAALPRAPIPHA